jgi:predicted CXXCH cytochrome family protein
VAEWDERPVKHPPFADGSCDTCHDPHSADHPGLASKAGGELCASCHPVTAGFKERHRGYPVETAPCQQCHDPHASKRAGLFRAHLHPPFEEGDCTTCHAEANAEKPFALVASQGELCGTCHEEQVEVSRSAPFPHVSAGGGRCTDCHNPHTGDQSNLLQTGMQRLCLGCHDPGGAKSGEAGRYVTHGGDLDCVACHAPHGGDDPLLLVEGPVETCGTCHEHEHGIRHPLGEGTRDPRNGSPMSCLSCHGLHDAPYEHYMHASDERDLCLGCHKDIGGGR